MVNGGCGKGKNLSPVLIVIPGLKAWAIFIRPLTRTIAHPLLRLVRVGLDRHLVKKTNASFRVLPRSGSQEA